MKTRLLVLLLLVPTIVSADDGMWMPQQIPALGEELKKLGLQLDPRLFADLTAFPMGAIVAVPGCTASFVSAEGLIATNHHCVAGALQREFGTYADPELGTLPVAFVSSNVVTNGNTGSASMNAWGELAGLSFDVNWEGVGADYMVEQEITRSISVDSRYVLWVLDAIDGAHNLMREMGVEPQF